MGEMGDETRDSSGLALYQTTFCPFCVRVRRVIEKLGVEIEIRDIQQDSANRREIIKATGRQTVPVLRIEEEGGEVRWLPESLDIIRYLEERFAD